MVHHAEFALRERVTLLGGEPIPLEGLGVVLRHALAVGVSEAESALCGRVTLLGFDS